MVSTDASNMTSKAAKLQYKGSHSYSQSAAKLIIQLWLTPFACRARRCLPSRKLSICVEVHCSWEQCRCSSQGLSLPHSLHSDRKKRILSTRLSRTLPNNALVAKKGRGERTKGLTEIRGSYYNPVTFTYLDELLSDWGGASKVTCFESSSPLIYCPQSLSMALRYDRRGLQVTDIDERSLLAVHSHSCLHRA